MPFYISGFKKYFEVTVWNHYTYHKSLKIFHIIVYHHSVKKKWHYAQIVHITFTRNRQKNCLFLFLWMRAGRHSSDCCGLKYIDLLKRKKEKFGDTPITSTTPVSNTDKNSIWWKEYAGCLEQKELSYL